MEQELDVKYWENRTLFSEYYLSERLYEHQEWEEKIGEVFRELLELYRSKKDFLSDLNEAQTEQEFIQPILNDILGFEFDVQRTERHRERINTPDYVCFPDQAALDETRQTDAEPAAYYNRAIAVTEAKRWKRPLDKKGLQDQDINTNANPSFQIVNYLIVTGLEWGILTNGSQWRLYSTKARSRIDTYFEVDLEKILEEENEEQFRFFYLFFRKQAFQKDPQTGKSFLEAVYQGSIDYGTNLERQLKDLIFEQIFIQLAEGFVEYRKNEYGIESEDGESLERIYHATLRLLYRLLFLLHAESRKLLPLDNSGYLDISLQHIKQEAQRRIDKGIVQGRTSVDIWDDLSSLFHVIDRGDPDLNVPRYNGGLFRIDNPANQFLNDHKIPDKYLVPALEQLTRETDPETGTKRFIDFKALNVEQLGSVYEGLLEFKLRIAEKPLAVVRQNRREVYKPEHEVNNPIKTLQVGDLYLENDKGERKATGSYYTPHYIVEYITEHTLGPVFEERADTFRKHMGTLEPLYDKFEKAHQKVMSGDTSNRIHNRRAELKAQITDLENKAVESLLSIKVCDPAMGSGHFLKEATDKLAEKIIGLLAEYEENPVSNMLEDIRRQILESLEGQQVEINADEHLKDTNLIKRMVMKRCIYGVDLNPMAVELAKLSLWLDSFTVGAPLSFLDHHLKTGNSLIGATIGEIREKLETGQSHLFGGPFSGLLKATELMREVSLKTDSTFSEIEQSIEHYRSFEESVKPYKQILDIWVSRHFSNNRAGDFLITYSDQITNMLRGEEVTLSENQKAVIKKAEELQEDKQFFHWELEFLEVFVDLKNTKWLENPGFDVVVGNPPYDVLEKERLKDEHYHKELNDYIKKEPIFESASGGKQNLFRPFLVISKTIINYNGSFGQIVPLSLLTDQSCEETLRNLLFKDKKYKILAFPQKDNPNERVFPEAKLSTCVFICNSNYRKPLIVVYTFPGRLIINNHKHYETSVEELGNITESYSIPLASEKEWSIIKKIHLYVQSINLKNSNHYVVNRGEINQTNFKKYITDDSSKEELIKGSQIGAYSEHEPSQGVIEWFNNDLFKQDKGYKKSPPSMRVALQRISGVDDTRRLSGTLIDRKAHFADSLNSITSENDLNLKFILSLLNSQLLNWRFKMFSTNNNVSTGEILDLPVPDIHKTNTDNYIDKKIYQELISHYDNYILLEDYLNEIIEYISNILIEKNGKHLSTIQNFLSFLSERMLALNNNNEEIKTALNPFKFLNKGADFQFFQTVFSNAVKYGELLTDEVDPGAVRHDIESLHLVPEDDRWVLSLDLKHRDPEENWAGFKRDEEDQIIRSTVPVYRFKLSETEGRYWQQAFEVLDKFEHYRNFPGGRKRTTHEKLMQTKIPVFDEYVDINPLIELRQELTEIESKIAKTDWLIDQIVYRLYGLTEEEIEIVENSVG